MAFSDIWLDTIWQQHVLYWPPKDCSDKGLTEHHKHVQLVLRWLFDALDPVTCEQELVHTTTHEPIIHPPSPTEIWQSTVQPTTTHVPRVNVILEPPTTQEIAKLKAVCAAKYAVRPLMAVLHNPKPKPKVKQCHVGWNSHSIKLYADTTDVPPAHCHHHHHSWLFAGPSTASSSVKHGFVQLPVSPKKQRVTVVGDFHDLLELLPGSDDADDQDSLAPHEEYHLDPEAYSLAMAGDVEDIATAPQ
ncbi:hypothetical protein EDD18DRAFT_1364549 [Armillaria luteobubalina]|uniref:Uncharacterized protein n=1 Tax=Armillaria luteobubalina TaxID=153913 RepID=A0AA39UA07_9AGAR|nr:hypothetical protein EDD18DRAFT_1364549 [Armillaria luteobubalina]